MEDISIRTAAFEWLKEKTLIHGEVLDRTLVLNGFNYKGEIVTLIGAQGIWKPKIMDLPISITTIPNGPYKDYCSEDGSNFTYRFRGTDPNHRDNVGLRELMKRKLPLIYFLGIDKGRYLPLWPVYITGEDIGNLSFNISAKSYQMNIIEESIVGENEDFLKKYTISQIKQRAHQQSFREKVLRAYNNQCALCRLKHLELLDAAHIVPDKEELGLPIVQNGLSLCKIHHAAFDKNIIGISPDYVIIVRNDIMNEIDGPMLKYGIQNLNNLNIVLPSNKNLWPDKERLDSRYNMFLRA